MNKTTIQWTERTWNPVTGCSKLSAGCAHCYAETMANRLKGMGQYKYKDGFKVALHYETMTEPFRISKPSMFFVCSMGDLFHNEVPFEFIDGVMRTIKGCSHHTFQILTKRSQRMRYFFDCYYGKEIPKNLWIGVSYEERNPLFSRIQDLKSIDGAAVRFLSCEPLLGDLGELDLNGIDWVIVGGESGPKARPMKKEWVLNIQRQCAEQDVPFFFKQWGTWGEDGIKRTKKANGNLLNGQLYQEWPKAWKGGQQ